MNETYTPEKAPVLETRDENVVAGAVGAFLFSLAGGILWFVLYQIGFLAGISGFVAFICAVKGYEIFAKGSSKKGVVISVIASVIVIALAWYLCLSFDVYNAAQLWYEEGSVDFKITFAEAVMVSYEYLLDPEIGPSYWGDLAIGLALCLFSCFSNVKNALAKNKAKIAAEEPEAVDAQPVEPAEQTPAEPQVNAETEGNLN